MVLLCHRVHHVMHGSSCGCQPAPGLPCALWQFEGRETAAKLGRNAPRDREGMSAMKVIIERAMPAAHSVIASEAKQSRIFPLSESGLLRRFAPRNDGCFVVSSRRVGKAKRAHRFGVTPDRWWAWRKGAFAHPTAPSSGAALTPASVPLCLDSHPRRRYGPARFKTPRESPI